MQKVGAASVIAYGDWPDPPVYPGWVLVEVRAAGVNFRDTGVRRGALWAEMQFPRVLGIEGAGKVLKVGDGVSAISPGQRVAWAQGHSSYAERVALPAWALIPIPDELDDRTAAAIMTQGLAANYFTSSFHSIQPGETALVHAAAGGVGLIMTQLIKMYGGVVIGRVSSQRKADVAREAGADHIIVDAGENFAGTSIELSGGRGANVVYNGSGPKTFLPSIDCLCPNGTLCWYGDALGSPPAFDVMALPAGIKVGHAALPDYAKRPKLYQIHGRQLFDWVITRKLRVKIAREYHLSEAAQAHADIESRMTTGKLLLIP
jgi:NADPH2:quinone reductase